MIGDLADVRAKLDRAQVHLKDFEKKESRYGRSKPYTTRRHIHPEFSNERTQSISIFVDTANPVPGHIQTVIGDAIFNMRSALDHLARQLVIGNKGQPKDTGKFRTSFPICDELPSGGVSIAGGVHPQARAIINKLQPDKRANRTNNPLWTLGELNNIDKHRTLLVVGLVDESPRITTTIGPWTSVWEPATAGPWIRKRLIPDTQLINFGRPVVPGTSLSGDAPPPWLPEDATVEVDVDATPHIAFAEGQLCGDRLVLEVLKELKEVVETIVSNLAKFV